MKLKDIFNIDLSTRGGAKLYRKIMGKYNIPKQDSKQLVKEIRNSSEGGGVKEYYYSVDMPGLTNLMGEETMSLFATAIFPNYVIVLSNITKYIECYVTDARMIVDRWDDIKTMIAIRVIDNIPIPIEGKNDIYFCYGNIFDKLKSVMTIFNPSGSEEYNNFVSMISPYISEISKEEYESLIEQPAIILGK